VPISQGHILPAKCNTFVTDATHTVKKRYNIQYANEKETRKLTEATKTKMAQYAL